MEVKDLLKENLMIFDLVSKSKNDVIDEMIEKLYDQGIISDKDEFKKAIFSREEECSTALGDGVAIPHARVKSVNESSVLFAKSDEGVEYDALDGKKVNIFFLIAVTEGNNNLHIDLLSQISKLLLNQGFIEELKECNAPNDVYSLIDRYNESDSEDEKINTNIDNNINKVKPLILAVTACPTGIAHTYMAQEAIIKAAKKYDIDIKVETNGSDGVKDQLSDDEIDRAIGIIIAADKNIEKSRFNGKKLIDVSVSQGIKDPDSLIESTILGKGELFFDNVNSKDIKVEHTESNHVRKGFFSSLYTNLMNGVSHMLPFVVGGGILLAISFLAELFVPKDSMIFLFLNGIGSNAFGFLIPVLAGFIAYGIADRPGLMPGMVAGYIAFNGSMIATGSGFIGGLIGGFVAGYVVLLLKKLTSKMPSYLEGTKPMLIYPVFSLFLTGLIMFLVINPVFSRLNIIILSWLNGLGKTNIMLLGAVLGGMMSVDMGGPVNKAAYTFAIGVFTSTQDGSYMAAVMAGGMVAPLAVAIATKLWSKKFTQKEKQAGFTNYFLGFTFITEGAIPFAVTDGLRLIIPCIIGSAVAGSLTQFFNISSPAPHGGIFIIPAMGSISAGLYFLLSIVVGALVAGILYGILRKNKSTVLN